MSNTDFEEQVLQALADLRTDTQGLKADVGDLKSDVSDLKTDTQGLKADVGDLKSDVAVMKQDIRRLEVLHEETAEKIDQIIEVISPEVEKINHHAGILENHEERLRIIEKTA